MLRFFSLSYFFFYALDFLPLFIILIMHYCLVLLVVISLCECDWQRTSV